jgi:hypothetical protein
MARKQMARKQHVERSHADNKPRPIAGENPPPLAQPHPPGRARESAIPKGIEIQAQKLLHEAGSPKLAKHAVDSAAHREALPDFRQDMLAQRLGFKSRGELLAASTPITAVNGAAWWATAIDNRRWAVWSDDDMSQTDEFASLEEARRHIYAAT